METDWRKWNQIQNQINAFQHIPMMGSNKSQKVAAAPFKDAVKLMQSLSLRNHLNCKKCWMPPRPNEMPNHGRCHGTIQQIPFSIDGGWVKTLKRHPKTKEVQQQGKQPNGVVVITTAARNPKIPFEKSSYETRSVTINCGSVELQGCPLSPFCSCKVVDLPPPLLVVEANCITGLNL